MQLTNQQILTLSEAITSLDGQHLIQVVDGKAVQIFRSYKIASNTRWALARTQGKLKSAIDDFNTAKNSVLNELSHGKGVLGPQDDNFGKFVSELESLKRQTVDLDLTSITFEGLKLDENEKAGHEIPIAVLSALEPLILT